MDSIDMDSVKEIVVTTCPNPKCGEEVAGQQIAGVKLFLCPKCQTLFYSSRGKKVVLKKGEREK